MADPYEIDDPFRLKVLKALTAVLEEITVANGYNHDLTGKVFRGREIFGTDDPLPMLSILEAIEQSEDIAPPNSSPEFKGPWELQIQGFVEDDRLHPTDPAHFLMADVKKRLATERVKERQYNIFGLENRVFQLRISPGVVRPPDDVSAKAYFWLRITIEMMENLTDPFS